MNAIWTRVTQLLNVVAVTHAIRAMIEAWLLLVTLDGFGAELGDAAAIAFQEAAAEAARRLGAA